MQNINFIWTKLSKNQKKIILKMSNNLLGGIESYRQAGSDVIPNKKILDKIGDTLKIHHTFSIEPFHKEKFEHLIAKAYQENNKKIEWPKSKTEPYDLIVDDNIFSFKTQADKQIKLDTVCLSKLMELGTIKWNKNKQSFKPVMNFIHSKMSKIDRTLVMRYFLDNNQAHYYELIEIPKQILMKFVDGKLLISKKSKQKPPCATCTVKDDNGLMYRFYFDGGTEMKLRLNGLRKDLCIQHATWRFN